MRFFETRIPPALAMIVFALPGAWMHYMQIGTIESLLWLSPFHMLFPAIALVLIFAGIIAFRKQHTTVNPHHPEQASSLVTSGIFAYSRNPMYLGMSLCLVALAVKTANLTAFLCVPAFMLYITRYQIIPEERIIEAKFGEQFRHYKSRVRRWI